MIDSKQFLYSYSCYAFVTPFPREKVFQIHYSRARTIIPSIPKLTSVGLDCGAGWVTSAMLRRQISRIYGINQMGADLSNNESNTPPSQKFVQFYCQTEDGVKDQLADWQRLNPTKRVQGSELHVYDQRREYRGVGLVVVYIDESNTGQSESN